MGAKHVKAGDVAGCKWDGYICIKIDRRKYLAHRLAWLIVTGEWPPGLIDHEDTNRSNNRFKNLRCGTHKFNAENQRRPQTRNRSGFLGVYLKWDRLRLRPYVAEISVAGAHKYLGHFATANEAHAAYVEAKRLLHPGGTL